MPPALASKADIINFLIQARRYTSYLEICTRRTGGCFAQIASDGLDRRHRLMYRCPFLYSDGSKIDFRVRGEDWRELLRKIRALDLSYDVILVDPWHEYETSLRDLDAASTLLNPGGTIVVHDCLPPDERSASPKPHRGAWCGVTFMAYVDFVNERRDVCYRTVDIDYGCGVIRRTDGNGLSSGSDVEKDRLLQGWRRLRHDAVASYRYLAAHRQTLLNLLSAEDFIALESVERSPAG